MESKLKELRELIFKCEEVKKDVLELKFGCKLNVMKSRLFMGDAFIKEVWTIVGFESKYPQLKLFTAKRKYCSHKTETLSCINKIGEEIDWQFRDVEILGRDITLDHCLRAVIKRFSDCGIITKKTYHETFCEIVDSWLLGNPLQSQSEECIDSLIKLLK